MLVHLGSSSGFFALLMFDAGVVLKATIQNSVGREESAAIGANNIGAEDGERRALQCRLKKIEAIIEFVVAKAHGVIVEPVHDRNERMRPGIARLSAM